MPTKRVIPCLDVRNGRLTKGVKFVGNEDIGDPVETARQYYEAGADEIVFYDITASAEARGSPRRFSSPSPWGAAFPRYRTCGPCCSRARKRFP